MNPRAFDLYVRTITTAVVSIAITGAALLALLNNGHNALTLVAIAGPVIGGYFGAHIAHNGRAIHPRRDDYEMTVLSQSPPSQRET